LPWLSRARLLLGTLLVASIATVQAAPRAPPAADPWWKHAVIYEIYPRSFQDSNGDGVGDLNGITQRLDYLEALGVDAIWIGPVFPSPKVDFGYDVTDYESVDPQYGTMADLERLLSEAHKRQIRVLLDLVSTTPPTSTPGSSTRPGRAVGRPSVPVWAGPPRRQRRRPPNNWVSVYGGSAWEYIPAVDQFYYHVSLASSRPQLAQPARRARHV
jgi:alpha-glucosidase